MGVVAAEFMLRAVTLVAVAVIHVIVAQSVTKKDLESQAAHQRTMGRRYKPQVSITEVAHKQAEHEDAMALAFKKRREAEKYEATFGHLTPPIHPSERNMLFRTAVCSRVRPGTRCAHFNVSVDKDHAGNSCSSLMSCLLALTTQP